MQVTMTFNLPDEEDEMKLSMQGRDLSIAIDDYFNWLRGKWKHGEKDIELYEECRDKLAEFMSERNCNNG